MEMVPVTEFLYEFRPMVSGFMPDLLPRAILQSARRFCKDTDLLLFETTLTAVTANQQIVISDQLALDGVDTTGLVMGNIVRVSGDDDQLYIGGGFSEQSKGTITIFDEADSLTISVSMLPERNALELPETLLDDWLDGICAGAASYLYQLPENQDLKLHQYHEREYVEQMRSAKRWRLESLSHASFSPTKRNREFF
ncbi:hypothetical protein DI392_00715 [Vibrio albus]|uniref:Uncharacterized protein n=1 Tax=Vibrio albus TaxID=2200953 RepID=A0A2U3BDG3_9VIBR|nr:hypothetical protein [Vibrio albus]PWI34836.1 hypothetical protein DI392_00715 [Vibrio albus]